jgi:hypothetical protein
MEKITEFQLEDKDGSIIDWVKIDRGNDEFTWMTKAEYEKRQAEQSTPIDTGDE